MTGDRVKNSLVLIGTIFLCFLWYGFYHPNNFDFSAKQTFGDSATKSIKVLITGDIMLDRNVRNIINRDGVDKFFSGVSDLIKSADIAVGNLEGTFSTNPSVTASLENKALQFTFDPALAPALADLGFDILGLANNHSLNYGQDGLESTRRYIGSSGMFYYGDPFNKNEISTIITKEGITVGFVGFHEFNYINYDKVFNEIVELRPRIDVLIVSPHWGIEYEKTPTPKMVEWAHRFIDLGADAVVGAHPHVVQTTEEYKEKKIFYSLGNFVFDQYFSEETMSGEVVIMDIFKKDQKIDIKYSTIPVRVDREGVRIDSR